MRIDMDKIKQPRFSEFLWMLECKPEKYGKNDEGKMQYVVFSQNLGQWSKRDAEVICEFLKKLYTFIK